MLKKNYLIEKLKSGLPVIGTWTIIPSTISVDIIASSDLDFIIIDSEHGPINFETAQNIVITCESRGVSPVMRVGGIIECDILKALDIGIHCIHIPNTSTANQVKEIVRLMKYPPKGNRGFSPFTRAGDYFLENSRTMTNIANENILLSVHVEGRAGIENIDELLKIQELDIVFIGVFDISKSLGIPGDVQNPKVKKILRTLTDKINSSGKYPGSIVNSIEEMEEYIGLGVKYITYSVDCHVLKTEYAKISSIFRKLLPSSIEND